MRPQGSAETIDIMSKETNTGSVREARMEAKKLARTGAYGHQQALDHVARERGHRNWSSFLASEGAGGIRGVAPAGQRRVATSRDIDDATETGYLEDAVDLKRAFPRWATRLVPVLGGAFWMFLMLQWVTDFTACAIAMATYLVLTLAAGRVAESRSDGFLHARRRIQNAGMVVGAAVILISGLLYAYGMYHYGHYGALSPGIRHPLFERASLAYIVGITTIITSRRMHRAMTVATPDSVRPSSTGELVIDENQPVERPRLLAWLGLGMYVGTGIAIVGVTGLVGSAVTLLITRDLPTVFTYWSVGIMGAGVILAMLTMFGYLGISPMRTPAISSLRNRAARARRLVKSSA